MNLSSQFYKKTFSTDVTIISKAIPNILNIHCIIPFDSMAYNLLLIYLNGSGFKVIGFSRKGRPWTPSQSIFLNRFSKISSERRKDGISGSAI